jgi:hypothetical protein
MTRSALRWFCNVWTYNAKVLEYWIILSLKIQRNHIEFFKGNLGVLLILLESAQWVGFSRGDIIGVRLKVQNILKYCKNKLYKKVPLVKYLSFFPYFKGSWHRKQKLPTLTWVIYLAKFVDNGFKNVFLFKSPNFKNKNKEKYWV